MFDSPNASLHAGRNQLQAAEISKQIIEYILAPNEAAITQDLEWLQNETHHLITIQGAHYPKLLKQISDPPIILYAIRNKSVLLELLSDP